MDAYPIFRLALFLAAGIFFAGTFRVEADGCLLTLMAGLLVALGLGVKRGSYAGRWLFGAGASVFMFLTGMVLTGAAARRVDMEWPAGKQAYRGVVLEPVVEKLRSYQCRAEVAGKAVLVYFSKDASPELLQVGDVLFLKARIECPQDEAYGYRRGISGTGYVAAGDWRKVGRTEGMTLKLKALRVRELLVGKCREWGVNEELLPVFAALTLGYKEGLDHETREDYSKAGISHVLALSGLHVGMVWMLMDLLWGLLAGRRFKVLRCLLMVTSLWAFAFLVGLGASVVRAVVMCMLVEVGRLSEAKSFSLNTLAVATMSMLLYNPFYLFDVGFQLSFVAVLSILILSPFLIGCVSVENRLGRWAWRVTAVSVSAQLGTAPLVVYYFSGFPAYFLLGNLVVAVLVPLIIYATFLLVLVSPLEEVRLWVVKFLNLSVDVLNGLAGWVSSLPYSHIPFPVVRPLEIILFYSVLGLGLIYWKTRRRKWFIGALAALAGLLALHLYVLCGE